MPKYTQECSYCSHMFDCEGRQGPQCLKFEPQDVDAAARYKDWRQREANITEFERHHRDKYAAWESTAATKDAKTLIKDLDYMLALKSRTEDPEEKEVIDDYYQRMRLIYLVQCKAEERKFLMDLNPEDGWETLD